MGEKKISRRFTIQFSRTDPAHLQAVEILNRQGRRSKAQYLVNAVLHYENCGEILIIQRPAAFDEKIIEAVVNRILHDRKINGADAPLRPAQVKKAEKRHLPPAEEIDFNEAMETLGEDGFNNVVDALDMFRKK